MINKHANLEYIKGIAVSKPINDSGTMSLGYFKVLLLLSISVLEYVCILYEFRFETLTPIKGDTETLIEFNLKLLGRHRVMNGTIKCNVDIDNEFVWKVGVEQHINGDWKPLPVFMQNTTCGFLENVYSKYWEESFVDSNLPKGKDACPWKKGEYYVRNVTMRTESWMGYVKQGLNRCKLTISKNNITYGGFIGVGVMTEVPI